MKNNNEIEKIGESIQDKDLIDNAIENYLENLILPINENEILADLVKIKVDNRSSKKRNAIFAFFNSSTSLNLLSPVLNSIILFIFAFGGINYESPNKYINNLKKAQNAQTESFTYEKINTHERVQIPNESTEIYISENSNLLNVNDNQNLNKVCFSEIEYEQVTTLRKLKSIPIEHTIDIRNTEKSYLLNYEFKRNSFINLNKLERKPINEAILEDFSFGLWFNVNHNFKLGAEFRQEEFVISNGNNSDYYFMNCWEFAGRYFTDPMLFNSKLYLQSNIGGGSRGMIFRLSTGINYPLFDAISITSGIEYNSLLYFNQSKIQNNDKIGFSLGLIFNLDK